MNIHAISVDDEEINLLMLNEIARQSGIELVSFLKPLNAVEYIKRHPIDLAFVDYMMPDVNGIEMIAHIRAYNPDAPIVMITAYTDRSDIKMMAFKAGATEFLTKPIDVAEFAARTKNLVALRESQLMQRDRARLLATQVEEATMRITQREFETLTVLGKAAEYRDPETANHILRVAHLSKLISGNLGMDANEQDMIFHAAPLHDVGKIGIPDSILLKPAGLTDDEYNLIKTHTIIGYNMLKDSSSLYLRAGAEIALTHHEHYSGAGYPQGLLGDGISLYGRIVAVADSYDAMVTRRPYKEPWPVEKALKIITLEKGRQFDPIIVEAFLALPHEAETLYERYTD